MPMNHKNFSLLAVFVGFAALAGTPGRSPAQVNPVLGTTTAGHYPYTASDVHFIAGMIGHHAQAITMAGWAPTHGAGSSVRILCERIINAQADEIALMQRWLEVRHQPIPEPKAGPMRMTMNGVEMEMLMPGMLSDEEMKQLEAARGTEFDRRFLRFMIQHHQGAITMVNELFASQGAGQDEVIFKFASDVYADQGTEIDRMQKMLILLLGK